jgi:poly(A) polymerase
MTPTIKQILQTLNDAGYQAFIVGGFVRDGILGLEPKDADITTSATPEQVAALFPTSTFVGASFGVTLIKMDGKTFEIATFRQDGQYTDGRHPDSVQLTTDVREDVLRRDFTIGALLMNANGEVIDLVKGMRDLEAGVIRTVGAPSERFAEDALRMLRAIRFATRLGFSIAPDTMKGIQENAYRIQDISKERIAQELVRILTSGRAKLGIELLDESGLLKLILPDIADMKGCEQQPEHHPEGDVFVHTLGLLAHLTKDCTPELALAALLHDVGKPKTVEIRNGRITFQGHAGVGADLTRAILNDLKMSNDTIDTVTNHVRQHMTFMGIEEMRHAKALRFMRQDKFAELLELHRLDCLGGCKDLKHYNFCLDTLAQAPPLKPARFITGYDLIQMGLKPGAEFRTLLEEMEDFQLEGKFPDREAALEFLQAKYFSDNLVPIQEKITGGF